MSSRRPLTGAYKGLSGSLWLNAGGPSVTRPTRLPAQARANSTSPPAHPSSSQPSSLTTRSAQSPLAAIASRPDKLDAKGTQVVPPLSRPPGVPYPPEASPTTYISKDQSKERKAEEKAVLFKEVSKGYYHDLNRASRGTSEGKLWIAPKVLIREDKALYLPNIGGSNLLGQRVNTTELCRGKTTLLALTSTRLADEHVQSFVQPVMEDQAARGDFQYVKINHQPNQLKAALVSLFLSSLKRTVPESQWKSYILSRGEWSQIDVSNPLLYDNKIIGYVYLLDPNLRIRWAGCGHATEDEVRALRAGTEVLLTRIRKGTEGLPGSLGG